MTARPIAPSTSSRWRPSWPASTPRRCASTSARASSSRSGTEGRSRRYSDRDIALLRRIQELTNEGVSLVGVRRILELEDELDREVRDRVATSTGARATPAASSRPRCATSTASYRRDLVPVSQAVATRHRR